MTTVSWKRTIAAVAAAAFAVVALVVVLRSDGLPAVDAASSRATHWFVHRPSGRVILADGYGGRALASLEVDASSPQLDTAESSQGAYLINGATAEVQAIDTAELRLGSPMTVDALSARSDYAMTAAGLVIVDPVEGRASLLPANGDPLAFDVATDAAPDGEQSLLIAPDGSVWSLDGDELVRTTSAAATRTEAGSDDAELSLVGNSPFVLDAAGYRARLGNGDWQELPTEIDPSELVVQVPGPPDDCGWVGADDQLWCVSADGIEREVDVEGLDIDSPDRLAIAGGAAALIRRGPSEIVHFDWRSGEVIDEAPASLPSDASLTVEATVDLVWVDDPDGDIVWSVHPWGIESIQKDDDRTLVLGNTGEVVEEGESAPGDAEEVDETSPMDPQDREPDDDGIDDPPIAVDDLVTARSGVPVPVTVTANDYDPDGEAIAVVAVESADHGAVEIGSASTVIYNPDPGYVGRDSFGYTITDGDGTEASAEVRLEILSPDAANQPPVGAPDEATTGPGNRVEIDVLLNDIDPERDSLRIGSFSPPRPTIGEVRQTVGKSGSPALRFVPADGFEGTATFSYRPEDVLGGLGGEVDVRVEVASADEPNRPPVAGPDAVRLRRGVPTTLPVLVNDVDDDGDSLIVSLVEPLPAGLVVDVDGEELDIVAQPGSDDLITFEYEIDDGNGHRVRGAVLVVVIGDAEPNRPPIVSADTSSAVVGVPVEIDVLANDSDPDGDPLVVVDVTQPANNRGRVVSLGDDGVQFTPSAPSEGDDGSTARFTYTVSDGHGNEVVGEVSVAVLLEALGQPPFARDDSASTAVDVPVVIDVLRNDGDPSGEPLAISGTPGCPAGGTAVVTDDGRVQFTPPRGQSGAFRCTYAVANSQGLTDTASIIVSVTERDLRNRPPHAVTDNVSVAPGEQIDIEPLQNDRDPDGDVDDLRLVSSTSPTLGTARRTGDVIRFTADDRVGVTSINYQVADGDGGVGAGTVSITIRDLNEPPVATAASRRIEAPAQPQTFDLGAYVRDPDGSGPITITGVNGNAPWALDGLRLTISPAADFLGTVVFRYTAVDGDGGTDSSTVTLTVVEPANRPPRAVNDSVEISNGASVSVPVLLNDEDLDGDPLSLSIVSGPTPALGSASTTADGRIAFRATPGQSGTTNINYQISDGELTARAVLSIAILPCAESAPTAADKFLETGYQQPINVPLASYVTNGTVVQSSGPPGYSGGVYRPPPGENGNVVINYTAENGCGQRDTGTVTIDVNQQPTAGAPQFQIGKNQALEIAVTQLASDDEPLTIASMSGAPAWVTRSPGQLTVAPPSSTVGRAYEWTVQVSDPGGLTVVVPVRVTIINQPPVAVDDVVDATSGSATVNLVVNDTDADDGSASLRISNIPSSVTLENGVAASISLTGDQRTITVVAGAARGRGSFEYTVVDPSGATSVGRVQVIGPAIPPPTTTNPPTTPPTTPPPTAPPPPVTDPSTTETPTGTIAG